MRRIGYVVGLLAGAHFLLLPSPAFADEPTPPPAAAAPARPRAPDSSKKATGGWIVVGAGGALVIGGIVLEGVAAGTNDISGSGGAGDGGTTHNTKTDLIWAGSVLIVAGLLAGVYGGSMVVEANRARAGEEAALPPPSPGGIDPLARAAQASLARTPSLVVPLVGMRF